MSTIAAIDPGLMGALVLVDPESLVPLDARPMPVVETVSTSTGKKKKLVDMAAVAGILRTWHPGLVLVEQQGTRPQEGIVSAFTTGRHFGALEGVCAGLALGYQLVHPTVWTAAVAAPKGKGGSLLAIGRLQPAARDLLDGWLSRKPHKIAGADAWGMCYAYMKHEQALAMVRRRRARTVAVKPAAADEWAL